MLSLKSLKAENFRSYKSLDLQDIDQLGLTLIKANNGAGKSSIRLLIEYLLTDTTSEKIPLDELTYNKQGNCKMECVLEDDSGTQIRIIKYREHKKYKNQTILEINGVSDKYTATDRRETQKNIENVLGINASILNVSTIFSQFSDSFPQLKESERKALLYKVLDLEKYNVFLTKTKQLIESVKEKTQTEQAKLDSAIYTKERFESDLEEVKHKIEEFENDRAETVKFLTDKLENTNVIDTTDISSRIDELQKQIADIDTTELQKLNEEKTELVLKRQKAESVIQQAESLRKELDGIKFLDDSGIKEEIVDVESEIKKIPDVDDEHLANVSKELECFNNKITKTQYKIDTLQKQIEDADLGKCPILKIDCDKLLDKKKQVEDECRPQIDNLTQQKKKLQSKAELKQEELNLLKDHLTELNKLKNYLVKEKAELSIIEQKNKQLQNRVIEIETKLKDIDTESATGVLNNTDISDIDKRIDELNSSINKNRELEEQIRQLQKEKGEIEEKNKSVETEIARLKAAISEKQNAENPHMRVQKTTLQNIKRMISKIHKYESIIKQYNDDLKYYEFWKVGFSKSGIPNLKIDSFLSAIEEETNKILSEISDNIYVELDSQTDLKTKEVREKISYKVFTPNSSITDFFSYSGGQRQRVLLADKFAFSSLLGNFNFLIFDEALELSLDDKGKDSVIQTLRQKQELFDTIFVMSHDVSIQDKFDSIIEIDYNNGVSTIRR